MNTTQQTKAKATFEITTWDEKPYLELDGGAKLTRAKVIAAIHGDLEGEGTRDYLMFYPGDGSASFVGQEYIIGRLGDRAGSFVLQHTGTDDGHTTQATYFVVPGSGTGELRGLQGKGRSLLSRNQPRYSLPLTYDFDG